MEHNQIRLTKGLYALVSESDYSYLKDINWHASHESRGTKWYAKSNITGTRKKIRMHRFIVENRGIKIPDGYVVDHKNHNSLDNRFENLEVITQTENMRRSPGWKKKGQKCNQKKTTF